MKMRHAQIRASLAEQAMVRLMRVGDRLWRDSDARFAQWGLTDNHYNVLRILNGAREPLAQVAIGRRMLSSRANVTKLVDALEARGFARRTSCADRRVNLVELTEAGARFIEQTNAEVVAAAEEALAPLSRAELKALFRLLGRIRPGDEG
jgi:MarR family 2-MHQ and catechol resistance regulon transcriptional repressor